MKPLLLTQSELRVLLVEDNATDTLLVCDELEHAANTFLVEPCTHLEGALGLLQRQSFDVVLLDLSLPDSDGLATFMTLHLAAPELPIVVLSHRDDEALALQAVQAGAQDYLVKGQTEGVLVRAVRYAVERARLERERKATLVQLRLLQASVAHLNDVVLITDANAQHPRIVYVNDAFTRLTGYTAEEALGSTPSLLQGPNTQREALDRISQALALGEPVRVEVINYSKAGAEYWLEIDISPLRDSAGVVTHFVAIQRDIGERKAFEAAQLLATQEVQTAVRALESSQRQLQTLSRRILNAQETERRRVALELHDDLGQALTAVKINLMSPPSLEGRPPTPMETQNIRIVEDALQQVRRIALALRPSMLDDLGLEAALTWLVQSAAIHRELDIDLQCHMVSDRIAPEIETACFRIVQESLTNIRRHARAKRVEIRLQTDADNLELSIKDDGIGFELTTPPGRRNEGYSLGLLGIRERAVSVGGSLGIETSPGQGCTVRMRCALDVSPLSIL